MQAPVDEDGAEVDRQLHRGVGAQAGLVAGAAERAAQVAAEEPQRRDRVAGPAGGGDTSRASASERTTTPWAGSGPGSPQASPFEIGNRLRLRSSSTSIAELAVDHAAVERVGGLPGAGGGGGDRARRRRCRAAGR